MQFVFRLGADHWHKPKQHIGCIHIHPRKLRALWTSDQKLVSSRVLKSIWETIFVCSGQGRQKEETERKIPPKSQLHADLHSFSYMSQHVTKDATIFKSNVSCINKKLFSYLMIQKINTHIYPPRYLFNWSVQVPLRSTQKNLKRCKWALLMRPPQNSSLCTQGSSCRKQGQQASTARRVVAKELNALSLLEGSEGKRA